jgi:hypothetical protein
LRQEYLQITQSDRNAGTTNDAPSWPQVVRPKACTRYPVKDCETTPETDSSDDLSYTRKFNQQGFKPRPIQNRSGVVLTMDRRVIKHWAANKPRRFGLKGISHDMNIINLSPISETDAEG